MKLPEVPGQYADTASLFRRAGGYLYSGLYLFPVSVLSGSRYSGRKEYRFYEVSGALRREGYPQPGRGYFKMKSHVGVLF